MSIPADSPNGIDLTDRDSADLGVDDLYFDGGLDPLPEGTDVLRNPSLREAEIELRRLYFTGERDSGGGGVAVPYFAEHFSMSVGPIRKRIRRLEEQDRVVQVTGLAIGSGMPRDGWAPADAFETPDEPTRRLFTPAGGDSGD